jgi:hypothetical protein
MIELHLDDDRNIPEAAEHVAKHWNAHPAPTKWIRTGGIDPTISGIDPRELGRGATIDGSGCIGGSVERRVVAHDDDPIGGKVYVEFQPVSTGGKPTLKRGQGVFRTKRATPSVREDSGF